MAKIKEKTVLWKLLSIYLFIIRKKNKLSYYQYPSLPIMIKKKILTLCFLS